KHQPRYDPRIHEIVKMGRYEKIQVRPLTHPGEVRWIGKDLAKRYSHSRLSSLLTPELAAAFGETLTPAAWLEQGKYQSLCKETSWEEAFTISRTDWEVCPKMMTKGPI
ncbi:MAG: hypothetical protein ACPF9I_07195, partial [Candidatus Thalassarchaeaceae archaeon]